MTQRRAVVTGAGRFVGFHLVRFPKGQAYWVRGVDLVSPAFALTAADESHSWACAVGGISCGQRRMSTRCIPWPSTWAAWGAYGWEKLLVEGHPPAYAVGLPRRTELGTRLPDLGHRSAYSDCRHCRCIRAASSRRRAPECARSQLRRVPTSASSWVGASDPARGRPADARTNGSRRRSAGGWPPAFLLLTWLRAKNRSRRRQWRRSDWTAGIGARRSWRSPSSSQPETREGNDHALSSGGGGEWEKARFPPAFGSPRRPTLPVGAGPVVVSHVHGLSAAFGQGASPRICRVGAERAFVAFPLGRFWET
jgi:hypothetical protein